MEDLIELVAASFARHGIECQSHSAAAVPETTRPDAPTALPEHNFRKGLQPDPAP